MNMKGKGFVSTVIILIGVTIFVLAQDPMPQSLKYHDFVDSRMFLSVPNFFNVLSNLPFILVGSMGLYGLLGSGKVIKLNELKAGYFSLFLGLLLIGFGSGYYHLWPSNQTLLWDRLPMTLVFMALVAVIIGEYVSVNLGKRLLYPLLMLGGASVLYWYFTEYNGAGDLRFYLLVQLLPLIVTPLLLLFMKPAFTHGSRYWWLLCAYVFAKIFERYDAVIFESFSVVSGHTVKHLIAALGMFLLLNGYKKRSNIKASE